MRNSVDTASRSSSTASQTSSLCIPLPSSGSAVLTPSATIYSPSAVMRVSETMRKKPTHEPNGSHLDSSTTSSSDDDVEISPSAAPSVNPASATDGVASRVDEVPTPKRGFLPSLMIFLFKWVVIVVLFTWLIICVRATCCVTFSLFPFSCSLYFSLWEAAEKQGGGLGAFIASIQVDHVWNEILMWWGGVEQCLSRY